MPWVLKLTGLPARSSRVLDLRTNENVDLRGEQVGEVMDAFVDAGDLGIFLEVFQHVAIDDRRIDAT